MLAVSLLIASKLRPEGKRKRSKFDYSKLPQSSKYDVENGYLLDISEGDSIEFTVEAPLTYAHPVYEYQPTLRTKILDYGDMYSFTVEGEKSHLSGDWGEIEIIS